MSTLSPEPRRVTDRLTDDDRALVASVLTAAERADGAAPVDEAVTLALAEPLTTGSVVLLDPSGFALVRAGDPTELDVVVHPDARRRGLATRLVEAALREGEGPWAAWSHGDHPGAGHLVARFGFTASRALWVMRLAADHPLPEVPAEPALRAYRPGEDDAELLRVNAAAFADHPEQGALDQAGLDARRDQDWFDPAGLLVAERDGRLTGFHWTKVHPATDQAPRHGEVYVIGVDPAAQGGGLGRTLLLAGLQHLRAQDVGEIVLYVESDNDPAVALYEKYGFTHAAADTHVQYTRA